MFNNKFYNQIDVVAMWSSLDPFLVNIFMCNFENKWLKKCPHGLKPVFYGQLMIYVVLLSSLNHAEKFNAT